MKKKFIIGLTIAAAVFILLFSLRLIWGYIKYPTGQSLQYRHGNYLSDFRLNRKNIANYSGILIKQATSQPSSDSTYGKYEKVGSLVTQTTDFKNDEIAINQVIRTNKAIIQYEQKTGLKSDKNRLLKLGIGVHPSRFETMIQQIKSVGKLVSLKIIKTEKTNEYKELQAKRKSLEKSRAALAKYRGIGNKVAELISLENRILEIETKIQSFGVELGDFDSEHEFVTVKVALVEQNNIQQTIPISQRLFVALEWTIKNYFTLVKSLVYVVLIIMITLFTFFMLILLIEKLKIVNFNPIQINLGKHKKQE